MNISCCFKYKLAFSRGHWT